MNGTIGKLTAAIRIPWRKNGPLKKIKLIFLDTFDKNRQLSLLYRTFCRFVAINGNVVLLVSHHGKDFFGNPYYIAQHLLQSVRYQDLHLIIVCPRHRGKRLRRVFGNGQRLTFCHYNSPSFCFHLARAKYLITDVTFPIYFSRRKGQSYLNTWHGTPLKTLGRRVASDVMTNVQNTQRNFLHTTHLLAPNEHTENVLLSDYMIRKIWSGTVVRGGYPRNDAFFHPPQPHRQLQPDQYHVVFMPTWRGNLTTVGEASNRQLAALQELFNLLEQRLDRNVTVWVRLHPLAKGTISLANYARLRNFPEDVEPYQFLAQADALLTDYSSVLFDFAVSRKPILLYTPDLDDYAAERDFCLPLETLPFMQLKTPEALIEKLSSLAHHPEGRTASPTSFLEQFCSHDQGRNTEELCAQFFSHASGLEAVHIEPDTTKKNILIYGGTFLNNGITNSLKPLIQNIDQNNFNIILFINSRESEKNNISYFKNLDINIDFIPYKSFFSIDAIDLIRLIYRYLFSSKYNCTDKFIRSISLNENFRLFGKSKFDIFVNFEGYSWKIALIMSFLKIKKVIFFHNDMQEEIESNRVFDRNLLRLSYECADIIALVREGIESNYCNNGYDFRNKSIYVPNNITAIYNDKIKEPLENSFKFGIESENYYNSLISLERDKSYNFINIGRFSKEKGQIRLINAFEQIWQYNPLSQLFIIGPHGLMYKEIFQYGSESIANSAIHIILGSDNPFPLMGKMNALILSSFYEGLPVVLFEAFALNLPVVSTNIPGPAELLQQGYGLVVDNSEQGLVDGMLAAMNGQVPQRPYDFEAHNRFAMEQFYKAIET